MALTKPEMLLLYIILNDSLKTSRFIGDDRPPSITLDLMDRISDELTK